MESLNKRKIYSLFKFPIQKIIEANKINIVTNPRNMFLIKKANDHMPLKKVVKKVVPKLCVFF